MTQSDEVLQRLQRGASQLWLSVFHWAVERRWDVGVKLFDDESCHQAFIRKQYVALNAADRDLMKRGKRHGLGYDGAPHFVGRITELAKQANGSRCVHCYDADCSGCKRKRHARYSEADYSAYESSESDLVACLDLLSAQRS